IGDHVDAYILNGHSVTARAGDITLTANVPLDEGHFPYNFTTANGTETLSAGARVQGGDKGGGYRFLGGKYKFTTNSRRATVDPNGTDAPGTDDDNELRKDEIVKLADDYVGRGQAGAFYAYQRQTTPPTTIDLGTTDFTDTTLWKPVTQNLG